MVETCWKPVPQPHTQALTLLLSVSCRDTFHGGRNRTHLLDSVSSRRYLCHQDRLLFASSLPVFLPLLLSPSLPFSFIQILMTCALCVRNLVGNLSMASRSTPLHEYSFHETNREPGQKQSFLTTLSKIPSQVLCLMAHSSFLICHCLLFFGPFVCISIVSVLIRRNILEGQGPCLTPSLLHIQHLEPGTEAGA